jgi:hypothetical protein
MLEDSSDDSDEEYCTDDDEWMNDGAMIVMIRTIMK